MPCLFLVRMEPRVCLHQSKLLPKTFPKLWHSIYTVPEWVDSFSIRKFLEPIGNIRSAELEVGYYHQLEEATTLAESNKRTSGMPVRFT